MTYIWKGADVEDVELPSGNVVKINPSLSSWNMARAGLLDESKFGPVLKANGLIPLDDGEDGDELHVPLSLQIDFVSRVASMVALQPKILLDAEVAASRDDSVYIGEIDQADIDAIVERVFGIDADEFPDDGSSDGTSQDSESLADNSVIPNGDPSGMPSGGASQPDPSYPTQPGGGGGIAGS